MDQPQQDAEIFDELLDFVLPVAERLLRDEGEFLPFAAATSASGEVVSVGAEVDEDKPDSHGVLEVLVKGLRTAVQRHEYVASGVCSNVRVSEPGRIGEFDAVRIHFEAHTGEVLDYFRPYDLEEQGPTFGEPFLRQSSPYIFFLPGSWAP